MAYPGTGPDQKAIVDDFTRMARAATVQLWQLHKINTALIEQWNAQVLAILGPPQGITITDGTNYAGAGPLTDTELTNLFSILQTLDQNTFTPANMNLFVIATGPSNML